MIVAQNVKVNGRSWENLVVIFDALELVHIKKHILPF